MCVQKLAHADAMTSYVILAFHILESPLYNIYSERGKNTIDMTIYLYITYLCVQLRHVWRNHLSEDYFAYGQIS